jgi:hypothetical protein
MVEAIKSGKYPFMMCNFAPPDMVGHTGVYEAAVVACAATGEAEREGGRPLALSTTTDELMYMYFNV